MKKLIVLIITFSSIINIMQAQDPNFGIKGGLNISNITGGDVDRNNLFNFHIGGFAEFTLNEKLSIQPELLYTKQGSEVENTLKVKIDYLAIPVLAKYYLFDKFSVEAGPQFSFLVNDKIEFSDNTTPDAETDASSFDFGLNFGFEYDVTTHMFVQTRYNYGITTISENPDVKNSVFQIALGYKF
ncbi:porin family protein [Lacinutrix sp. MedPE-SW]|uniref:porin family protein n=1 Tax=Lacinutrix sp. MedPE-SW TaxID=1860087 RepID=UPI0009123467|nr:porin family protein [Lacinutrix sp. MedPE-SW]OIQ22362.1 MAG: hypothetical protein BM549_07665 [Lacinutrix sp. MedPE-SW]